MVFVPDNALAVRLPICFYHVVMGFYSYFVKSPYPLATFLASAIPSRP